MNAKIYLFFISFFAFVAVVFSQNNKIENNKQQFEVEVKVVDQNTNRKIKNAELSVNGIITWYADFNGIYKVKAKVGDELIVSHPDFETVRYRIKSDEEIKIVVQDFPENGYTSKRKKSTKFNSKLFHQYIDSASFYKKKDIDKSISFIAEILKKNPNKKQTASSYELLADIYFYWKQYDLASDNYLSSLELKEKIEVLLKLANTQFLLKKYQESKDSYHSILTKKLTKYQRVQVFEGLGNVLVANKDFELAKTNFSAALNIAQDNLITPKITDLNSKLADVSAKEGNNNAADSFYQNSLELASKENTKRSLKEQEKVADYYNKLNRFDDEIKLRQKTLETTKEISNAQLKDSLKINNDSINSQKINYKIGNAYLLKEAYSEAIPFLEESKKEANEKEDFAVEKDATRKLSEVYKTVGEYTKALKSYEEYVKLVDKDYVRKQQEIQQVKRFLKKIADNQSRIVSLEKDKELADSKINLAVIDQKLSEESNRKQRILIYSLFGGVLLLSLLAYFMYRTNKQQKLANNLLALKSMRSQMNPHFIFNALNSVNSFIAVNDERNANRYLSEFSVLMRSVLENSDEDFIPLSKEIELLELYVKLEHNRFKDKFEYTITVDNNIDVEAYKIPPMLLQPYIENAIWHGLRYKEEKGNLSISIQQKNQNAILITIEDDGIGRTRSAALKTKNQLKQKSKGMSTIKNRIAILNNMYKDKIAVVVSDGAIEKRGTKVEVVLKK